MLDVACNIQRVHYKSMKFDVFIFVRYLGEVEIFVMYIYKIFLPAYNSAKIIKINQDFPKL